ncbi:MAG: RNA 3'-terminal phosphate cyclase [Nitrososphaerota archaeon]|nr:RNA 3'-terminal phosphate cyclase [Nitrososphaerota archaeon]
MEGVEIDGSQGEGGGQILRIAVAFAAIKRVPVRVVKIREGREVPGLKRQHLSALRILSSVFGGRLEGDEEGSMKVTFVPGGQNVTSLSVDMGTAASITLVLQAVIPAVALSGSELRVGLTGGTDVPWSPTFDYFSRVALEGYRAIGIEAMASASRRGYYPKGGGQVSSEIRKCAGVTPIGLADPPSTATATIVSRCGSLPRDVAARQARAATELLGASGIGVAKTEVMEERSNSPGTSVLVYSVDGGRIMGTDAIGERGKPAEDVGAEAAAKFVSTLRSGASIDANLSDMLLPLLSLASAPSRVRVPEVTPHLESGMFLAEQFTSCRWKAEKQGSSALVTVRPAGT